MIEICRSTAFAVFALVALSGCATASAQPSVPPAYAGLREHRAEIAAALAAQASYCFGRHDTGDTPIFHGCVDWHSASHGAWALSAYQRATGDRQYAAQLEAAFTPADIATEAAYLRAHPNFEMPYGRAWFLRLAVERRRLGDHRFDAMAAEVAQSLRDHYTRNAADPTRGEYQNPSWALINLLLYARETNNTALIDFVHAQVRSHFTDARCDLSLEQRGFIAVCTSWAWLVEQTLPAPNFRAWYSHWNPGLETLRPLAAGDIHNAHDYGRNFSRAWGLYHLAETLNDDRLRTSYTAHVNAGFEPRTQWSGEYMANGHWVAQFGMLALQPTFD
ncbi:DUF2891 family protein [Terricaulis sp.]|uniref:DUF2891 family protein n=1 Tax=Terricaulis sp. TaxID=2768686 RepID=UPI003782E1AD